MDKNIEWAVEVKKLIKESQAKDKRIKSLKRALEKLKKEIEKPYKNPIPESLRHVRRGGGIRTR